ncbi:MAG: 50S ribosomal protein L25, partial [Candidatus Pacebacteria bacterium]|nr:50S ribosomal protein L25 [Candidatus Paceibacterota bacterium]
MGNKKIVFHTKARDKKTKMNSLRVGGFIPGNVYGLSKESESIFCEANAFKKLYEEVGDTGLIYVKIDDAKEQPVLIDEVSEMSVGNRVLHVAFKRVNLNVAVSADVPIELVGENEVRDTIVTQVKQDVEVEALPQNLPEKF